MRTQDLPNPTGPIGTSETLPGGLSMLLAETQPYRACYLCTHGLTVNDQRYCRCKAAVAPAVAAPVHLVRASHGACGPEAHFMAYPGF